MQPNGTRVHLRTVVGGMALLGLGYYLHAKWSEGLQLWVLAGGLLLLLLSAASLALMFRVTRHDTSQRGFRRWILETLKLTGTIVLVFLTLFVMLRGYAVLAGRP